MKVATDAIIIDKGKILLVQQRKPQAYGLWSFPGGHVEADETLMEALHREIAEELGVDLMNAQQFEISRL